LKFIRTIEDLDLFWRIEYKDLLDPRHYDPHLANSLREILMHFHQNLLEELVRADDFDGKAGNAIFISRAWGANPVRASIPY
jgi:hypothetical protein